MKKCSSVVWRFFDRVENENKRCFAVLCKLCDTQYKFFGNTTNLRAHLINKHPLQWELSQSGTFDESSFRVEDDESNQSTLSPKRRKYKGYKDKNVRYSISVDNARNTGAGRIPKIEIQRVDVLENTDLENEANENEENEATYNLVRQLHDNRGSDEEWLEEDHYAAVDTTFEPKRKRVYRKIKREVITPPPQRRSSTYVPHTIKTPLILDQSTSFRDEYAVFGEYVANKLRKFKGPRTRGNLQQLITTILWQAEYGTYDNADAVKRVLMYTAQEPEQSPDLETHIHVQAEEIVEEQRDQEPNQSAESESLVTMAE
ncbi:uncharacterized protein LOC114357072 isoform X1 [Ostrinia furnacalis]|uniref:uncharacterized protein LOC114357072 isoform X1 n=1 Tax=Ostrinia furnacalis TaxID=93504 RepID=UPI001039D421|nr:uncharacterized protein LOC114357072 isoform X1 [Ostrinia furnacalis]